MSAKLHVRLAEAALERNDSRAYLRSATNIAAVNPGHPLAAVLNLGEAPSPAGKLQAAQ